MAYRTPLFWKLRRTDAETWQLKLERTLTDMEVMAILATHAARFGTDGPELAPDEVYDRVSAFVLTYGLDAVQDTLTLPDGAVGWARRHLDRYQRWLEGEESIALADRARPGRPRASSRRPLASD